MPKITVAHQLEVLKALLPAAAGYLVGMNRRSLGDKDAPRLENGRYDGQALVRWAITRAAPASDDDPLMAGGSSPNLERYRAARAEEAEMNLAERRKQLVHVDELVAWWQAEIAGPLRRSVEALKRQHGAAAAELVLKPIVKAQAAVEKRLAEGKQDD